ncbi:bifunctional pyr operon transcriptional regulator/uracil phosphoribosyltransferase PyrR [Psychroflexus planctonicus]|uniref:Bifunctional pyrimidine operon regulatory protein/uracil phosphoribosyltransferase n=1 Tax=Psychroflexus planctonicus TaxID=1526575 RepID=A0ABQ1SF66_9FLAO|nr:bifunctional pyr operon transcriptional regulator/uracil phosphoribosyltransferase PyrR [Psychroflexus planctonicus]GGE27935.1 bifunctional pyrimidine operon regulatory protein/uracil phosphoribosyltransferase [Psychroflexus planctonicus]
MSKRTLLNGQEIQVILQRLACQLIENHSDFKNTVIIGLQPRGVFLANRIQAILEAELKENAPAFGKLDITFYRDDFRRGDKILQANQTEINFIVENKHVIFVDDVLYTGRSIRSALTAIQSFGRPKTVELLTLIDRRFSRHLPIQPDYNGKQVDAINHERVVVKWKENDGEDVVEIIRLNDE